MRTAIAAALVLVASLAHAQVGQVAAKVYFSPHGGCTDAIVAELAAAKRTVRMQAYSMTSAPIAKALVDAAKRGVDVQVILDRSNVRQGQYSSATFLAHEGIATTIDAKHQIAHNKVIVVDGVVVLTGSFNFTKQAENANAENLLVLRDRQLATAYEANWKTHHDHAEAFGP
jgi:phosphatidylserine/phosphatidylglycerophosphate/cardiolipin synthase-like enzyme